MTDFRIKEDYIHYAASFLERWEDKAPNQKHKDALKNIRAFSNYLIENLGQPTTVTIIRNRKDA